MRSKLFTFAWTLLVAAALTVGSRGVAQAQDGEPVVIDSVVAQVNSDIIMLSMLNREIKDAVDAFVQQGLTPAKAAEEVAHRKPELVASLIDELLLVQKGKDLNLSEDVEAEVNHEMLRVMKEQGFKTIQEMEEAMRREGIDPAEIRHTLRTQYMKNAVLTSDVDRKIYDSLTDKDLKSYYESHRDKFRTPEVVKLSEIFLSLAGKNEADVRAKATEILTQLRGGADFKTLAAANSDRFGQDGSRVAVKTGGEVGSFAVTDMKPEFVNALKNVQVGGVTDVIRSDEGLQILRVDARTAASEVAAFDENKVREAVTIERRDKEREEYMKKLRKEAYIKLAPEYQATVTPLLKTDVAAPASSTTTSTQSTPPAARNNNGKKPQKQ